MASPLLFMLFGVGDSLSGAIISSLPGSLPIGCK